MTMRPAPLILILAASPAAAHVEFPVAPAALMAEWRPDPAAALALAVCLWAYGRGLVRLWRRAGYGRGVSALESLAFAAGIAALALAFLSPLDAATGTLLTAHMIQHLLLIAVAPLLILLGRPDAVLPFAFPEAARRAVSRSPWLRPAGSLRRLARPLPAALLHALALWLWHAPGPFEAALRSNLLHDLEHASFLATALLFWQSVIFAGRSPSARIAAIVATLVTLIQSGFLGALITLAGRPLYQAYRFSDVWGLTPAEDQQLAGLVMWIPMGAIYLVTGLVLAAMLIGAEQPGPPQPAIQRGHPDP